MKGSGFPPWLTIECLVQAYWLIYKLLIKKALLPFIGGSAFLDKRKEKVWREKETQTEKKQKKYT